VQRFALGGSPGPLVRWSCRATGRAAVARVAQPAAAIVSRREMRKALDWRWLMRDRFAKCEACPFIKASATAPAAWRYSPQSAAPHRREQLGR
jgi:hypothetical protein